MDQLLITQQGRGSKAARVGGASSQSTGGLLLGPVSPESMSPPPLEERAFHHQQQQRNVHVAQDLLSLKYGEESQVGFNRTTDFYWWRWG